jgi:hypothetical protein
MIVLLPVYREIAQTTREVATGAPHVEVVVDEVGAIAKREPKMPHSGGVGERVVG